VTLIGGQLAAMLLQVLLQQLLTEEELYAWGWRIPFVVGAALAIVVFWIRRGIHETRSFTDAPEPIHERGKALLLFLHYPKATAIVVALTAGGGLGFYTYTTYMQKLLVNTAGFAKPVAAQIMTWVLATFMLFPPLVGWISDQVGRRNTLMAGFGVSALLAVPVLNAIAGATDPLQVYLLCLLPLFFLSGYSALSAIVKAELYPAHVRALGVAVPYAIAMAIFGGNAETAALWFKQAGMESGYYWVVAGIMAVSFVVAASMRDTREHSLIRED
jgi:MHS family alpha-ketoglutarate permease-like MFS transporter